MKGDAKLGLFVFLVLVIAVVFLVAHEWRQRKLRSEGAGIDASTIASADRPQLPGGELPPPFGNPATATGAFPDHPPIEPIPSVSAGTPGKGTVGVSPVSRPSVPLSMAGVPVEDPATPEPSVGTYTVKEGDSLWKIAQAVYGDGSKWPKVMEANRDKIPSKDAMLKVGTVLKVQKTESTQTAPRSTPGTEASGFASAGDSGTYVVKSGDSLWKIAKAKYGDGSKEKIDLILAANRDKIRSANTLRVGMTLIIPETDIR